MTNIINRNEVKEALGFGAACLVFRKVNGSYRCMLATRDNSVPRIEGMQLAHTLNGMDNRNSKHNAEILSVIDLMIKDARSFRLDKLIYFADLGGIGNQQQLDKLREEFTEFESRCKEVFEQDKLGELEEGNEEKMAEQIRQIGDETLTIL